MICEKPASQGVFLHELFLRFYSDGEKTLKSRMLAKCSQVERQAHTPFAKWIPSLKREAEEWGYVRHKFEEGQRLVRTRYQVVLISPSRHMSAAEQSLFNLYRANRWELCRDTCLHLPSLFSCLPMTWAEGSADDNRRFK